MRLRKLRNPAYPTGSQALRSSRLVFLKTGPMSSGILLSWLRSLFRGLRCMLIHCIASHPLTRPIVPRLFSGCRLSFGFPIGLPRRYRSMYLRKDMLVRSKKFFSRATKAMPVSKSWKSPMLFRSQVMLLAIREVKFVLVPRVVQLIRR